MIKPRLLATKPIEQGRGVEIVCLATLIAFASSPSQAEEARSVPLVSTITGVQPMTGVVLWSDNEYAAKHSDAITLEYRYCGYDEVVTPSGAYDFAKLDAILDSIASRNHQAVLRFYFAYVGKQTTVPEFIRTRADYRETIGKSEGEKTHFCDWSNAALREFTLEFYSKLAEHYDADPRVAFFQTGFGLWAEYHIYDGPRELGVTFPDKQFQRAFLRHLDSAFNSLAWSISVDSADDEYSPLPGNNELLALDFGLFDDSFLCKPHPKENALNWKALGPNRWQRQPGGGEFSYYNKNDQRKALDPDGPNGMSFKTAAERFHITYMIGNDQPRFQSAERIASAGMVTGYRFRVTSAKLANDQLRLRVTNEGVAPIYRDAFFAAGESRSTTTLRGLLPGDTIDCVIDGVDDQGLGEISIQCDAILPTQRIEFEASLK